MYNAKKYTICTLREFLYKEPEVKKLAEKNNNKVHLILTDNDLIINVTKKIEPNKIKLHHLRYCHWVWKICNKITFKRNKVSTVVKKDFN